jgi:glucoamylase
MGYDNAESRWHGSFRQASIRPVYDAIPEVAKRYLGERGTRMRLEVWKQIRHARFMRPGEILRVQDDAPFTLHWSGDNWKTTQDTQSAQNALQIDYVDLPDSATSSGTCIRFTFLWTEDNHWEGQDYAVTVR